MYSKEIDMIGNRFLDNWGSASFGLLLKDITDGLLKGNVFENNTQGIYADGSNRLRITDNDFIGNGWAMNIFGNCEDNEIHRNNFLGNAFDITTNSNRNPNSYLNNFWDQYNGYDLDRDGIGDVPYRPVRLFSYVTGRIPEAIVLHRSFFVDVINLAEKVAPSLTPVSLEDPAPRMKRILHDRH
jgi:nitrous oxidase accessory protein